MAAGAAATQHDGGGHSFSPSRAHGHLTGMDGARIPYRCFGPSGVSELRASVVLLHGAAPYGAIFERFADALNARGIGLFVIDQRGFGETTGLRGHANRFSVYLDDCAIALSAAMARWPGVQTVLCGHSFGGLVALRYCVDRRGSGPQPSALVLISPWIKDRLPVSSARVAEGLISSVLRPRKQYRVPVTVFQTGDPRNTDTLLQCDSDPLWVHEITAGWFAQAARAKLGIFRAAGLLRLPVLQIEGSEDCLVDPQTNRKLFAALGSSEKKFVLIDGLYHDFELQADMQPVVDEINSFLILAREAKTI